MTKREEQYRINLYEKFEKMLNRFMDSNTVEWSDKEKVLLDFKDIINDKIHELHSEDIYMDELEDE